MKFYLSKDSYGLIQLWKSIPTKIQDSTGNSIYGLPNEIGIEVNNVFNEQLSSEKSPVVIKVEIGLSRIN